MRILLLTLVCAATLHGQAAAQSNPCDSPCGSFVPRSLFFAGAGTGLGIISSGEQSVYNKGLSTIYQLPDITTPIATGTADGPPVTPTLHTQLEWVPSLQFGYFQHFGESNWLWGVKQSYAYQGATLVEKNLVIPQFGTSSDPNVATFDGFSVTRSYEVHIDHQFTLLPFVGRSFSNCFLYAGAGPSLSRVGARLTDVVGFADISGLGLIDVSGSPQSISDSQWAFGIAAAAGFTYFITPTCFVDINYTFSNPFPDKFHVESQFQNDAYNPLRFEGTLLGDYTAKLSTHVISISLNFGF